MKGLIILVLIAVGGYYGYNYYIENKSEVDQKLSELVNRSEGTESITGIGDSSTPSNPTAPAAPAFESKIAAPDTAAPGEKQFAPPGVFYVVDRVSVMTNNGVKAVSPGEMVKLLQRLGNGRMRVTTGDSDFEVKESQVTNDLDIAREAEKKEFVARGGKL